MARHTESSAMIRYLNQTIQLLLDPIEQVGWANWQEGDDTVDGSSIIQGDLMGIAGCFSQVDGSLSLEESAFLGDIREFFSDDDLSNLTATDFRAIMLRVRSQNPDFYSELYLPTSVNYCAIYDGVYGTEYADTAKAMFFRFANAITKADGRVTPKEGLELSQFKEILYPTEAPVPATTGPIIAGYQKAVSNSTNDERDLEEVLAELNSLVGLNRVKDVVDQLVNFLKVQRMRESKGMETHQASRHLVFYGNPGTGKTTVARLLAQVYRSLGVLSSGRLVETDRSGLVAGFVGQTALKVREVVDSASGGILFIDEAYALSTGTGQDFGQEAIDILIKLMEDNRDNLIVVVAGYTDKMSAFLASNPGMRSRFNTYLYFDDYEPEELVKIFEVFCQKAGYRIAEPAKVILKKLFSVLYETRDETFGNGRLARNIFEMTINNQANRLVSDTDVSLDNLATLTPADVPGVTELQSFAR